MFVMVMIIVLFVDNWRFEYLFKVTGAQSLCCNLLLHNLFKFRKIKTKSKSEGEKAGQEDWRNNWMK